MRRIDATTFDFISEVIAGSGMHNTPDTYRVVGGMQFQSVALIYTRAGHAFFRTAGREFVSRPRDLVLLRPVEPIEYGPQPPSFHWATYWAHFDLRPAWMNWFDWPEELPGIMRLRLDDTPLQRRIVRSFDRLARLSRRPHPFHSEFALHALEGLLLRCRMANPRENRTLVDPRVQRVVNFLSDHFAKSITLNELARLAKLSPAHLEELFKQQVGLTPFTYLESRRIRSAMHLLRRTSKPIAEVAREVGFTDAFYFSKRFHLRMKISPRDFRKRSQLTSANSRGASGRKG